MSTNELRSKKLLFLKQKFVYCAFYFAFVLMIFACGESKYKFKNFSHTNSYKKESDFNSDSSNCKIEKDKHSNKIEGRKFGFKGINTGYLGCMQLKGWRFLSDN